MRFLISLFIFISLSATAKATPAISGTSEPNTYITCDKLPEPLKGGYCLYIPLTNPGTDILYYFHGKGGSELNWGTETSVAHQIEKYWREHNYKRPTVVSVSFGPIWLLATKNDSPASGLFEAFTQYVMPQIEQSLGGLKGRRLAFGISMGAVNTIQLAFKSALFAKAAPICSPMATISPFSTDEEIKAFAEKTIAHQYYSTRSQPDLVYNTMSQAAQLSKYFFPTPDAWKTGNPFDLADSAFTPAVPPLYVAAGMYDEYGLFESTGEWVGLLQSKGIHVEWHPMQGNHCVMDIPSLAEFLAQ